MPFYPPPPLAMKTELPQVFYSLPNNYPAHFSTRFAELPKRGLLPLAPCVTHTDFHKDIVVMAAQLQRDWPERIWDVNKSPTQWEDLLIWFDPYDIHILGASFLLQVLYRIWEQNVAANDQMEAVVDEFAADWVAHNEILVLQLRFDQDIMQLLAPGETVGMKPREIVMFSIALNKYRQILHSRQFVDRNGGNVIPIPGSLMVKHGAPPFQHLHPTFLSQPGMRPQIVGAAPVRPAFQQTPTAERLVNGLRLSAAGQAKNAHNTHHRQRPRAYSNNPALQGTPQPRKFSNDSVGQSKLQPRRNSNTKRGRPRGWSSTVRNGEEGPQSSARRHTSNPPTFIPVPQYEVPASQQTSAAQSPPRMHPFIDPAIIAQSPPRQQALVDPSILARGPEHNPIQPPIQLRHMHHISEHVSNPWMKPDWNPAMPIPSMNHFQPYEVRASSVQNRPNPTQAMPMVSHSAHPFPRMSQDARVVYPLPHDLSQQHSHDSFHNRHVSQQGYSGHRVLSSHSSTSTHTVRVERYEYQGNRIPSNGARTWTAQQEGKVIELDSVKIVTFNGKSKEENADPNNKQTLLLQNITEEFFDSPKFRAMLDQCGEVCDMNFNRSKATPNVGQSYVHFASVAGLEMGMKFFHNYRLHDGRVLSATQALPRKPKFYPRNNYEFSSYVSNGTNYATGPRRPSIHTQTQAYRPHQYSNRQSRVHSPARQEPLTDGFQWQIVSATMQLEQETAAPRTGIPLEEVSNVQKKNNAEIKSMSSLLPNENLPPKPKFETPSGSPKKENVPFSHYSKTPSGTPGNAIPQTGQKGGNKNKQNIRKGGKKNGKKTADSSTHPTPNPSPIKLESVASQGNVAAHDDVKKPSQLRVVTVVQANENAKGQCYSISDKSGDVSTVVQSEKQKQQVMAQSDTSAVTSAGSNTAHTNSFASTAPPSRQVSTVSMSSVAFSETTPKVDQLQDGPAETLSTTPAKKSTKAQKKAARKAALMDALLLPLAAQADESNITANELVVKKNTNRSSGESSCGQAGSSKARKKTPHAKNESSGSATSHDSIRKADSKKDGSEVSVSQKGKTTQGKEDAKDVVVSKAQSDKSGHKTLEVANSDTKSESYESTETSLKVNYNDDFPSLEPPSSPATTIADGKRPAAPKSLRTPPSMGQLNQNSRAQPSQSLKSQYQTQPPGKPLVAVPKIVLPGKKPHDLVDGSLTTNDLVNDGGMKDEGFRDSSVIEMSIDVLGSIAWPFVKAFREA